MSYQYNNVPMYANMVAPPMYNQIPYGQVGYPLNYPQDLQSNNKFSLNTGLLIGIGIAAVIILSYIYWAYYINRYSSDRIGGKLLAKYISINKDKVPGKNDVDYLTYDVGRVNAGRTLAYTNILTKGKENQQVKKSVGFELEVKEGCSPLSPSCISL